MLIYTKHVYIVLAKYFPAQDLNLQPQALNKTEFFPSTRSGPELPASGPELSTNFSSTRSGLEPPALGPELSRNFLYTVHRPRA